MAIVEKLLCGQPDGTISFGDYTLSEKKKVEDYLLQSVSKKESTRLMTLYTKELEEFYQ